LTADQGEWHMMLSDQNERRKKLREIEEELHNAYMASEPGSPEERALELSLVDVEADLDALWREEEIEWEMEAARSRRPFLWDAAYGRML
jgi:hypothetical protein